MGTYLRAFMGSLRSIWPGEVCLNLWLLAQELPCKATSCSQGRYRHRCRSAGVAAGELLTLG